LVESIQFQKICSIPSLSGFSLVTTAVAEDQSLLFLFVEVSGSSSVVETFQHGVGIFPRAKMEVPKRFCLQRMSGGSLRSIDLPLLDVTFPRVDTFPDGRILLASPRCSWRAQHDYDLNGIIFDPGTGRSRRMLLGDGIDSMQIDRLGRIWVSYIDEGIFGNFGWGTPGPPPVGSSGLACFSASGEKLWEFPGSTGYDITDCYALNVSGSEAAIFFYTDFPICRISGDYRLSFWKTDLQGCHAFALSETEALFSGQYKEPPDLAHIGRLVAGELTETRRIRLLMPDGTSRPGGRLQGRGRHLYHFDAENVCCVSLD